MTDRANSYGLKLEPVGVEGWDLTLVRFGEPDMVVLAQSSVHLGDGMINAKRMVVKDLFRPAGSPPPPFTPGPQTIDEKIAELIAMRDAGK